MAGSSDYIVINGGLPTAKATVVNTSSALAAPASTGWSTQGSGGSSVANGGAPISQDTTAVRTGTIVSGADAATRVIARGSDDITIFTGTRVIVPPVDAGSGGV